MPVFAFSIAADQHRLSEGDGFVRAETIQEAVALIGLADDLRPGGLAEDQGASTSATPLIAAIRRVG